MNSRVFYSIFAFTLAFLLGLIASWAVTRQYVSGYTKHTKCPYTKTVHLPEVDPNR